MKRYISIALITWATTASADKLVEVDPFETLPTQFGVGYAEIEVKLQQLDQVKDNPKKLDKYLEDHPGAVVIGPEDKLYLVDGHHDGFSLVKRGIKKYYVKILEDWSNLTPGEFWKRMKKEEWVMLDDQGKIRDVEDLPKSLKQLKDDPHRSSAWFARKAKAYKRVDKPYQEFAYANHFRERMDADYSSDAKSEKTFQKTLDLVESDEASHLPGYTGKKVKCDLKDLIKEILED